MSSRAWACSLFAACWFLTLAGSAQSLRVDRSAERMRVDGALREWKGARFAQLGDGEDAALRFALASTDAGFFIGAEISDDQLVRKDQAGPGQDALVLALALPDPSGALRPVEIWLHPGRAGKQKALAALREGTGKGGALSAQPEIQLVEGPRDTGVGYVLEAFVPFSLLAGGAELWEQGRATLRFEDVDRPGQAGAETVLATFSGARPADWPRLSLGTGQNDFLGAFLSEKSLSGVEPRFDLRANVTGDATPERVVIVDKYVLVYGPHFKAGENYAYFVLPYGMGGGLVSAELLDVTDDGRAELLVRVRQRNDLGARELFIVLALTEGSIAPILSLEVKKEAKGGTIEASLSLDKKSAPVRITTAKGRALGLDQRTYQESPSADAFPILLPWGAVDARTYTFDGQKLALSSEKQSAAPVASSPSAPPAPIAAAHPRSEATTEPTTDLGKLLLAETRASQPRPKLRLEREANFAGGSAFERAFVHQKQVVVTGPDIGPAPAYIAYGPPLSREEDLLELSAADVTGDKLSELLVRYRMRSESAEHELLLVLQIEPSAAQGSTRKLRPLLLAEVTRRVGKAAILNELQLKAGKLSISPGSAQGFSEQSYPFDHVASAGIDRLLLPWLDKTRSYRFDGARLLAE